MSKNDRPSVDSRNALSIQMSDKPPMTHSYSKAPNLSGERQVLLQYTIPQESGELQDTHTCSSCQIQFTSIEEYLKHKQVHNAAMQGLQRQVIPIEVQSAAAPTSVTSSHIQNLPAPNAVQFIHLEGPRSPVQQQPQVSGESTGNVLHVQVENIGQGNIASKCSNQDTVAGTDRPVVLLVQQPSASTSQPTSAVTSLRPEANLSKKYKCSLCNKMLKDYSSWKVHKLTHSEQREWACQWNDCTYAFKTKGSLKRHMRRHTDERPFMCEFCHRSFRESGALTRHLKARTPCTAKNDSDFPKYGKKLSFSQNIPAAVNKAVPGELDAISLLPIAQQAGPVPEQAEQSEPPKAATKLVAHVIKAGQIKAGESIDSVLSHVPTAKKVQFKRVKVVTVFDSTTGKKMKIAVPFTSETPLIRNDGHMIAIKGESKDTEPVAIKCESISDPTQTLPVKPESQHDESIKTESNLVNVASLPTVGNSQSLSDNNESPVTALNSESLQEQKETENDDKGSDVNLNAANLSIDEEKCDIEPVEYKVVDNNVVVNRDVEINPEFEDPDNPEVFDAVSEEFTEEFTEEDTDGDFVGESSPGEFITGEADISATTVTVMNDEVNYFDLEDVEPSSEIQMSTEVVTSGDLDPSPGTDHSQEGPPGESMDIDQEQGVPLTNRKNCQACNVSCGGEEALKLHLKTHLIPAGYKCPVSTCRYIAKEKTRLALHLKITHQGLVQAGLASNDAEAGESEKVGTAEGNGALVMVMADDPAVGYEAETEESPSPEATELANLALRQLLELQGNLDTQLMLTSDHQTVGVLHSCPVCDRTFTLNYLKLHIRAHTGEKPYACLHCEKKFRTKDTLTKHMSSHSDVRNYKCGECGKMFKRISHAREHLKVHSHDRPYFCTLCDKAFKSANGCKVHLRTHSEYLPHECKVCMKRFRERSGLDRHTRTHTGEKPFKCKLCGRGFAEHGTLSRHLKAKVPCISLPSKYMKGGEQEHWDALHSHLNQGIAVVESQEQPGSNTTANQMWIDNQVEIAPSENSSEVTSDNSGGDMAFVIATGDTVLHNQQVSGQRGDSVLTEFSTVVTDTQEYIVSHKDIQVVNLSEVGGAQNEETIHSSDVMATKTVLDPRAQYIVTDNNGDYITIKNIETSEEITVRSDELQNQTEAQTVENEACSMEESDTIVESS